MMSETEGAAQFRWRPFMLPLFALIKFIITNAGSLGLRILCYQEDKNPQTKPQINILSDI